MLSIIKIPFIITCCLFFVYSDSNFTRVPRNAGNHWETFKIKFNKSYATSLHEREARIAWDKNIQLINEHNSKDHSYKLHVNSFGDMTLRKYLRTVVKLVGDDHSHNHTLPAHLKHHDVEIPKSLDWRKKGFNPIITWQKNCGACYAFAIAHALQAQLYIVKNKWERLSEQQIVDCSGDFGNYGCEGGTLLRALKYVEAHGIMSYKDYPFMAKKTKCRWRANRIKAKVTSWGIIPHGDEAVLERAVALLGPVAVSINAAPLSFSFYDHGVYDDHTCTNKRVNHAVLVVGYSPTYWILLNWWGADWGERGYMRLKKGLNLCGITKQAAYVVMD